MPLNTPVQNPAAPKDCVILENSLRPCVLAFKFYLLRRRRKCLPAFGGFFPAQRWENVGAYAQFETNKLPVIFVLPPLPA